MTYLRDLARRKVRTTLTVLGITIGIWALVVFGSMANKISALVEGGSHYYADKLTLSAQVATGGFSAVPMSLATADQVRRVDGVEIVVPAVMLLMDEQPQSISMGVPPMITGSVDGADQGRETFVIRYAEGRGLTAADEGHFVTVLGSDIARKDGKHPGDTITLRGLVFEVVGVMEPTLTAPDQAAAVPLHEAQTLLYNALPAAVKGGGINPYQLVTTMTVYPKAGVDPEVLANRIEADVSSVTAMTGKDFDQQIGSATGILNAILVGIALISLVVGGLSVVNTMAMSVAERTREIGIKRAIGGSRSRIVRELVLEAGLIGLIGGLAGLVLGFIVVTIGNEVGRSSGTVLFEMTAFTAVTAIAFSTILGALAGFVPAIHAARLDPVSALRYE